MDMNSTLGRIALGFSVRIGAIGGAVWIASYAAIAFLDAAARIAEVMPK